MPQKILKGIKSLQSIIDMDYMLVCDPSFSYLSIKDCFKSTIKFNEFSPNPLYEQVCKGIELLNRENCKTIVAVGGGSAIDVAKCIKLYCRMNSTINYLEQETFDSGITLIAIPTTAGTGSESTHHAVIYYEGVKQSISHSSILPNYAILEPSVLKTLPVYQKKCTMLDALCQGIESWWSVNSTDESKEYSRNAVEGIVSNWREYVEDNSYEAAGKIMTAANYGGRAINITATTAAHAMSYKLTSIYKLPHGHAVAVCLPEVWEHMLMHIDECSDSRGENHLREIFKEIAELINVKQFRELLNYLDIKSPVSEYRDDDIELLTSSVNPVRLKNNPVSLSSNVLRSMYERIVK